MKFYGTVENGNLQFDTQQGVFREMFLSKIKPNVSVVEEIKIFRPDKTKSQLGAFWGLAIQTILAEFKDRGYDTSYLLPQANAPTGTEISDGFLCEYLYLVCPIYDADGKRITLSKMDTAQAANFFDSVRNYAASQWSIHIPEPDRNWRLK